MADSSEQHMFEFAADDSVLGDIWKTKFKDKGKSLVKNIHEKVPIVLAEQVCSFIIICAHVDCPPWSPVCHVRPTVEGARPGRVPGVFSHQHRLLRHHHSLCICSSQGITLQESLQPPSYPDDGGWANAENHKHV